MSYFSSACIGKIESIQEFLNLYPDFEIKKTVREFKDSFPFYRPIRGDGNCFYRAFAFLLLKNTTAKSFSSLFPDIEFHCQKLPLKIRSNAQFKELLKNFAEKQISTILKETNKTKREELIQKAFNKHKSHIDILLISYLRSLNYWNISKNPKKYGQFTSDQQTLKTVLQRVQIFGKQSQGIELNSMSDVFKVGMTIICVQKSQLQPIYYQKYPNQGFYLFYRPGHYDLIYPTEEKNNKKQTLRGSLRFWKEALIALLIFVICLSVQIYLNPRMNSRRK